jgi:hypothetical protein
MTPMCREQPQFSMKFQTLMEASTLPLAVEFL